MSRHKEDAADFGPDPVEDAEREAHFETWKRKGIKRK